MSISVKVADTAAAISAAAAGTTWVASLNDWLHLAATVIAIVAGVLAIAVHRKNLKK